MTRRISFWLSHLLAFSFLCTVLQHGAVGQASVQGQWTTLSNTMPINPVHVALLTNGQLLVIAGSGNCPPTQSGCPSGPPYGPSNSSGALLLNPVTGQTISQFSLSWDMFCNGMVLLEDGQPFIAGGTIQYDPFYGQPQAATFDPLSNTFSNAPNMAHGRWYPTLLTLGDGRVMTFSGLKETGATDTAVEFYSPDTGWSGEYVAPWTPDLYPWLLLLPNGKVFYAGAQTVSKLFDPSTNTWNTNLATTNYSGKRTYGSSVLLPLTPNNSYDPKVMIMGGGNPATNTTEIIDMGASTPGWQYGPSMTQARIEMNAVILPNGKVLALGGSVNDEDTKYGQPECGPLRPCQQHFFFSRGERLSAFVSLGGAASPGCDGMVRRRQSRAGQLCAADGDLSTSVLVQRGRHTGDASVDHNRADRNRLWPGLRCGNPGRGEHSFCCSGAEWNRNARLWNGSA